MLFSVSLQTHTNADPARTLSSLCLTLTQILQNTKQHPANTAMAFQQAADRQRQMSRFKLPSPIIAWTCRRPVEYSAMSILPVTIRLQRLPITCLSMKLNHQSTYEIQIYCMMNIKQSQEKVIQ